MATQVEMNGHEGAKAGHEQSRRRRSVGAGSVAPTRLWGLAGAVIALLSLDAGVANAEACHPPIDPSLPQYIVGYGSLMETASKRRTAPGTGENLPVLSTGYQRGWHIKGLSAGFSTTYLGVEPEGGAEMVAALYRVFDREEMDATDKREFFYCRVQVPPGSLRMLDGSSVPDKGEIWIYVNQEKFTAPPSEKYPIVQSYVDIFIAGCMELKGKVIGWNRDFAEACVNTTNGWSEHWVNDRLYPRRPFIHQPKAGDIDKLLSKLRPAEFKAIKIE